MVHWFEQKTGATLQSDELYVNLDNSITAKGICLTDPSGDTLLAFDSLFTEIRWRALLSQEIDLRQVRIDGAKGHFIQKDSSNNFDFILKAFRSGSSSNSPSSWKMNAANTQITLRNTQFRYQNSDTQQDIRLASGLLDLTTETIDWTNDHYVIRQANIANTQLFYDDFRVKPNSVANRLDPGHIIMQELNGLISDLNYQNGNTQLRCQRLSGKEKSGVQLHQLAAIIENTPEYLHLSGLDGQMNDSHLQGNFLLQYTFIDKNAAPDAPASQFELTDALLYSTDLQRLADLSFLKKNTRMQFHLSGKAAGNNHLMDLQNLFVGINTTSQLRLSGQMKDLLLPEKTNLQAQIQELTLSAADVAELLPDQPLPSPLRASDILHAQGQLNYSPDQIATALRGSLLRAEGPLAYTLTGQTTQFKSPENLHFALQIDSLSGTSAVLSSLIPPDALPTGTTLPDYSVLRGMATGTLDSIALQFALLTTREGHTGQTHFSGHLLHPTEMDRLQLAMQLDSATLTRAELLNWIPDEFEEQYLQLPADLSLKGNFKGSTQTFNSEISAYFGKKGYLTSNIVRKNAVLETQTIFYDFNPAVLLKPTFLQSIGWAESNQLRGPVQLTLDTSGHIRSSGSLQLPLMIQGQQVLLDQWAIAGNTTRSAFSGDINAHYSGNFDLNGQKQHLQTAVDAHIQQADFAALPQEPSLNAVIGLKQINWSNDSASVQPGPALITYQTNPQQDSILFRSDWLNTSLTGQFNVQSLPEILIQHFEPHLPGAPTTPSTTTDSSVCDFQFRLDRPKWLTQGIIPRLTQLDTLHLGGTYRGVTQQLSLFGSLPKIQYTDYQINGLTLGLQSNAKQAAYFLFAPSLQLSPGVGMNNLSFSGQAANDTVSAHLMMTDGSKGDRIKLNGFWEQAGTATHIRLAPIQTIGFQTWNTLPDNEIRWMPDGDLSIKNGYFLRKGQKFGLEGSLQKGMDLAFSNFNLATVGMLMEGDSTFLGGQLTATARIDSILQTPQVTAKGSIHQLNYRESSPGDLSFDLLRARMGAENGQNIQVRLENATSLLTIDGSITDSGKLNLDVEADSFDLAPVQPLLSDYITEASGKATGNIHIGGQISAPAPRGSLQFHPLQVRLATNNVWYELSQQSLDFQDNGIHFNNVLLEDSQHGKARINGQITLDVPSDPQLNLNIKAENLRLLDTQAADSVLYYGQLTADMTCTVKGRASLPDLDITAKPSEESTLYYRYDSGADALDEGVGVVEFETEVDDTPVLVSPEVGFPFHLLLHLETNENLSLKMVIDPLTGDWFEGNSTGQITFEQQPDGSMYLNGRLELPKGAYRYTYNTWIKRTLDVAKGSSLFWTGDPYTPELNLTAQYKVRCPVAPLLSQSGLEVANSNQKETFLLNINVSGTPNKPEIKFKIDYPTATDGGEFYGNSGDDAITSAVKNINNDPAALTQQVFSLLAFNTFLGKGASYSLFNIGAEINNLITNQLNTLTKDIKVVDIGFDWNTEGNTDATRTNYSVSIRKSFLNNRLTIKAKGGVAHDQNDSNYDNSWGSGLQEFSAEYSLTPKGTWKLQAFSKKGTNLLFSDYQNLINGAGILFAKEFEKK